MRVLVLTASHTGDDARIVHRQARVLLESGHEVVLVAPAVASTAADPAGLRRIPVSRAVGLRRVGSWRAVRRAARELRAWSDITIVHDPELLPVVVPRTRGPVVWDVHEDFVASVADRAWIPGVLRSTVRALVRLVERLASRRCHLMLAEYGYSARLGSAPVVPNSTWVPDRAAPYASEPRPRLVYVGRLSTGRGVHELLELGRRTCDGYRTVLVGPADADVRERIERSAEAGHVEWLGPLPNPEAMRIVDGALVGLSLLHDEPNYRHSQPTKIIEYLAHGTPVITTPLPLARSLVEESGGGRVTPFGDVDAVVAAVEGLDADRRAAMGETGHDYVARHHNWVDDGARFVRLLEDWAS